MAKSQARRGGNVLLTCLLLLASGGFGAELTAQHATSQGLSTGGVKLEWGVGMRLRGEFQHDFNVKQYGQSRRDGILLERLRVELGLRFSGGLRLFVQGQDAHELGCDFADESFPNGSPYNNRFDLRQGYVEWNRIGRTPVGARLGRQSIAFADNRLMGPGEWGNVGRYAWDAVTLTWRSDVANMDLFYAFRVSYHPTDFDYRHFDYDVLGMFSTFPLKTFSVHAFYFLKMNNFPSDEAERALGAYRRQSAGVSLEAALPSGIDLAAGVIPQFGEWGAASVRALGGYGTIGYTVPADWSPRIGLHYAYGSGDSDTHDNTDGTFDGVFGAVDKYYGRMNLFAWANLHDLQLAVSAGPSGLMQITVDHHLFFLADRHDAWYYANGKAQRRDPTGASGVLVGQEVDLVRVIRVKRHTQFQIGYGLFVPGAFVRHTGTHGLAHGGFLQWISNF